MIKKFGIIIITTLALTLNVNAASDGELLLKKNDPSESLKEKVILKSGQTPFSKMGKNPFIYFLIIIFFVSTILKFRNNVFDN